MDGYRLDYVVLDEAADFPALDEDVLCEHCSDRRSTHTPLGDCTRSGHLGTRFTEPTRWTLAAIEQYLSQPDYECDVCHQLICNAEDPRHLRLVHEATEQARADIQAARTDARRARLQRALYHHANH